MPCSARPHVLMSLRPVLALLAVVFGLIFPAWADVSPQPSLSNTATLASRDIAIQCDIAANMAGRMAGIPDHVMQAIALVESGRRAADGRLHPWPWSINVEGTDHVLESRAAAIAAVQAFQAAGSRSIDVGCLQVNLLHHPHAFASLEQAFDPMTNARYAALFLRDLYAQTGSWSKAIAAYHSATPALGEAYRQKVMAALNANGGAGDIANEPLIGGVRSGSAAAGAVAMRMPGWMAARALGSTSGQIGAPVTATGRGLDSYRMHAVGGWNRLPMKPG